jgi:hypothetical protein
MINNNAINDLEKAQIIDFENISKSSISHAVELIAIPILEGEISASKKIVQFIALKDLLEDVITKIRPSAMEELKLSKGEGINIFGAKVEPATTSKYDFTACDDFEWNKLNAELADIKAKMKERELFLKAIKSAVYLPETGEVVNPPIVLRSETIKVTIQK